MIRAQYETGLIRKAGIPPQNSMISIQQRPSGGWSISGWALHLFLLHGALRGFHRHAAASSRFVRRHVFRSSRHEKPFRMPRTAACENRISGGICVLPTGARRALSVSRSLVTVTRNPKLSRGWRRPGIWRPSVHPAAVFFKFITNLRDQILANPVHFMIYCEKTAKNGRIGLFSVFVIFVIFCHF